MVLNLVFTTKNTINRFALKIRSSVSFLWDCLLSVRPSSFCNTHLILWGLFLLYCRPHYVRPISFCKDSLLMWGQPNLMRQHNSVIPELIIWGQTLFVEDKPYSLRTASFYEARPHNVRVDFNIWGHTLFCEANVNLWGWPHSHSLAVGLIIPKNSRIFFKISTSQIRLRLRAPLVRFMSACIE